ncbi:hypothetical protein SAMN04487943_12112 [Gracilibacillus orientalis]|uniref:Uncharacterized protein n=1 Tax=Gracilibacillus orientalis TaxID=334253 RepID=A0A1I4R673_9BACI|nr:hypothetical protein [Gracilibacillus orientalis]SFM47757.1 hypothetical protein SAMN04487943_12112 [Gracilibacillus orientalis]
MADQDLTDNGSGIRSLSGFAYQIRVFVYYMSKMSENGQIEFETIEDVAVRDKKIDADSLDKKSDSFRNLVEDKDRNGYYFAIQVKRTKIDNTSKLKILYNWLLLESSTTKISKYILFTEDKYGNTGKLFDISCEKLFEFVMKSNSKSNALISKVKLQYKNNYGKFKKAYDKLSTDYEFISDGKLDDRILDGFAFHFTRSGVSHLIYSLRVKELIQYINGEIISAVYNGDSYKCTFEDMMKKVEEISGRVKDSHYDPDYIAFRKSRQINLTDQAILQSREYLQLAKCKLSQQRIEEHLIYQQYYESIKDRFLEDNKLNFVDNIERTTYDNFCSVKEDLEEENKDTPLKRLNETKKMNNNYTQLDQTRFGSCISLTKKNVEEDIKISWEDEK